jgi:hypothetical protein
MKTAVSKILAFFAGHDRREKNYPIPRSYCICGALKPEVVSPRPEASLKTESRLQSS